MNFSYRINQVASSQTMEIKRQADELLAQGVDIVDLGAGDPDFDTPFKIREAAKRALDQGFTHYTPAGGIYELREAIVKRYERKYGARFSPDEVMVTVGAKGALFNIAMCLFDEEDEVILPSPYWVSYIEQIKLARTKPVILELDQVDNFELRAEDIERLITPKTKAIIINTPNNPTGKIIKNKEMKKLVEIAHQHDLYLVSDECYEDILFNDQEFTSLSSLDKERSLVVSAVSKTYAMTGWRLGYVVGPEEIITQLKKLQGHSVTCVNSIAQKAATVAFDSQDSKVEKMRKEYEKRRQVLIDGFASLADISLTPPEGAFYVFPNVDKFIGKNPQIKGSYDLAMYLLNEAHVAVVPGVAFGQEGHIRISFAQPIDQIKEGVERLKKALPSV